MAEAIQPPERPRPEAGSGEGESRRVADSTSLLVRWMSIGDANSGGFIHGGTVMRLVDEAGGLAAIKHSGRRVVTAGMDRMTFMTPVFVGELLRCTASVNAVWRSSMEVGVRVEAENPCPGEARHTSTAYLTMVALDGDRPTAAPRLIAETEDEMRRQREAELRRANRLAERDQLLAGRAPPPA
jgi:acyl-CoA hydrolase